MHGAALTGRAGPSTGHRSRWMGAGEHRVLPTADPPDHGSSRGADARTRRAADRVEGRRRRGGHVARVDVVPGARPVRPARRRRQPGRPRPRLLRRSERARAREAIRVPASRVPAVARTARGHPPGTVHRRPVDARLLPVAGRGDAALGRSRSRSASSTRSRRPLRALVPARTRSTTAGWSHSWQHPSSAPCSTRSVVS